ncbi:zinc-dependent metalloprotease, partial [Microbacterium sp.]|uniref:zinc-dependent metalloprotease n=1 Tax=Microbacterium sp. TaxID=51671 RepID=UPI003C736A68
VGGPAEDALGALVGLKLRPRRLREASAMWKAVTDAVGVAARDSLWDYPDLMPLASDIDDPSALIERLQASARGEAPAADEFDEALARLLEGDDFGGAPGDGDSEPGEDRDEPDDDGDEPDDDGDEPGEDRPEGDRPV